MGDLTCMQCKGIADTRKKNCVDMVYESNVQIETGNINQASRLVFIIKSGSHFIIRWESADMWIVAKKPNSSYINGNCKRVKIIWILYICLN